MTNAREQHHRPLLGELSCKTQSCWLIVCPGNTPSRWTPAIMPEAAMSRLRTAVPHWICTPSVRSCARKARKIPIRRSVPRCGCSSMAHMRHTQQEYKTFAGCRCCDVLRADGESSQSRRRAILHLAIDKDRAGRSKAAQGPEHRSHWRVISAYPGCQLPIRPCARPPWDRHALRLVKYHAVHHMQCQW